MLCDGNQARFYMGAKQYVQGLGINVLNIQLNVWAFDHCFILW